MRIDSRLRKARRRVAQDLEKHGYRISYCAGILGEIFTVAVDSIYSPLKDVGIYIGIAVNSIGKERLDAILDYPTHRKKEVWIQKFGESPTDPGRFLVYRIESGRIIDYPHGWPVEKILSSPQKSGAKSQKKKVSSAKAGS